MYRSPEDTSKNFPGKLRAVTKYYTLKYRDISFHDSVSIFSTVKFTITNSIYHHGYSIAV